MFRIIKEIVDGFDTLKLLELSSGTQAVIIPSCGAILYSFEVFQDNKKFNVIDSYSSKAEFNENVASKGFKGCKLSPFVCRINKGVYDFAENIYKINKHYIGDHAIHGLLYDQVFEISNECVEENFVSVSMIFRYRNNDPGYPFKYDCTVMYKLRRDNRLEVTTKVVNRDKGLIPIQDGWHPYFKLDDKINDLQLEFQAKQIVEFDDELLPTGKLIPYMEFGSIKKIGDKTFDNCFVLNLVECQPMCVLRNAIKKIEIEIHPDDSYPYLQIYIPPHRNSIALENLSGPPDGFNNKISLRTLLPGEIAKFSTTYKITLLI